MPVIGANVCASAANVGASIGARDCASAVIHGGDNVGHDNVVPVQKEQDAVLC